MSILVTLRGSHNAEPVETFQDLRVLAARQARETSQSFNVAYAEIVEYRNRYGDDNVYGPVCNGPRVLRDSLATQEQEQDRHDYVHGWLMGSIVVAVFIAGIMFLLMEK